MFARAKARTTDSRDASGPVRVLIYSSNPGTREQVTLALGTHPAGDGPDLELIEVATAPVVIQHFDDHEVDLAILDGEAAPFGGLGLAKQLKDEISPCPPIVVLTARRDDRWLASWSLADAVVAAPLDPMELTRTVLALLPR